MEERTYADFSSWLHAASSALRAPMNVTFELTRRCPLACRHCYNNLPVGDRDARSRELTLEEHRRILDELADLGCMWLLYTGGEIFSRPDFLEIYQHARSRGFFITLFTNATMITREIADFLADNPPFSIEVTVYGDRVQTYEDLTGVPGSHRRCRQGIELLRDRRLPVQLKTVALTVNQHEIGDMERYAQEMGLPFKFDAMMSPRIDCSRSPLEVRLTPEEVVALDVANDRRMDEWQAFASRFLSGPAAPASDDLYHCGGGVSAFAVDPYGGMSICVLSQRDKYDLRTGSVKEGWEKFLRQVRRRPATRLTKCTRCSIRSLCGMCPANGELENEDPEKPVSFLCEVAHLRALALGIEVPPHGDCEFCLGGSQHEDLLAAARSLLSGPAAAGALANRRRPERRGLAVLRDEPPAGRGCGGGCDSCS